MAVQVASSALCHPPFKAFNQTMDTGQGAEVRLIAIFCELLDANQQAQHNVGVYDEEQVKYQCQPLGERVVDAVEGDHVDDDDREQTDKYEQNVAIFTRFRLVVGEDVWRLALDRFFAEILPAIE